jgi:hypothetical protein
MRKDNVEENEGNETREGRRGKMKRTLKTEIN